MEEKKVFYNNFSLLKKDNIREHFRSRKKDLSTVE